MVDTFKLNHAGIGELLKSSGMHALISAKCDDVKAAAESRGVQVERGSDREPMPYEVEVAVVGDRVSGIVVAAHPAGLAAEAKYGTLTSALDGA